MSRIEKILAGLATYNGRDACIRVTSYFFLFLYGLLSDLEQNSLYKKSWLIQNLLVIFSLEKLVKMSASFRVLAKQFATTRIIIRFFDDLPAIYQFYKHFVKAFRSGTCEGKKSIPMVNLKFNYNKIFLKFRLKSK